jgi:hypothetical protein
VPTTVQVEGFNLGVQSEMRLTAPADAGRGQRLPIPVSPQIVSETGLTEPLGGISLAIGEDSEVLQTPANATLQTAQKLTVPMIVNGVLWREKAQQSAYHQDGGRLTALTSASPSSANHQFFRFTAKKGQTLLVDVMARRLGSALDPEIDEIEARNTAYLDANC